MPTKRGDGPMSTALASTLGLLGIEVQGDIGPWTVYTDRYGRKKWFLFSPPTKPPTAPQIAQRARFQQAQKNWADLTAQEKENLETACKKTSLVLTGQNLFISAQLTGRQEALQVIARQTDLPLPQAPII